jgi:hypothetical protein
MTKMNQDHPSAKKPVRKDTVGAVVLISLGTILLLHNLNLLPRDFWSTIWRYWPIIFILLGLEQLFGGSRIGQMIILFISFLMLYLILAFTLNLPLPANISLPF